MSCWLTILCLSGLAGWNVATCKPHSLLLSIAFACFYACDSTRYSRCVASPIVEYNVCGMCGFAIHLLWYTASQSSSCEVSLLFGAYSVVFLSSKAFVGSDLIGNFSLLLTFRQLSSIGGGYPQGNNWCCRDNPQETESDSQQYQRRRCQVDGKLRHRFCIV